MFLDSLKACPEQEFYLSALVQSLQLKLYLIAKSPYAAKYIPNISEPEFAFLQLQMEDESMRRSTGNVCMGKSQI